MAPTRVMLDTSAARNLERDSVLVGQLSDLVDRGEVILFVCRTVAEELWAGHRQGSGPSGPVVPVRYVGNTAPVVGLMAVGDSLGDGKLFRKYMQGATTRDRENDALVADAAVWHADVLVTDDKKAKRRLRSIGTRYAVLGLDQLAAWLGSRAAKSQSREEAG